MRLAVITCLLVLADCGPAQVSPPPTTVPSAIVGSWDHVDGNCGKPAFVLKIDPDGTMTGMEAVDLLEFYVSSGTLTLPGPPCTLLFQASP